MKHTLKIVLIIIGFGFLLYASFNMFGSTPETDELQKQLFAMMGVGIVFLLAGFSLGRR